MISFGKINWLHFICLLALTFASTEVVLNCIFEALEERFKWPLALGMLIKLTGSGIWAWRSFKREGRKSLHYTFFASNH